MTNEYDHHFKKYAAKWLPGLDWRWLKAQGMQESWLRPSVTSHVGAMGIMQIMPDTWTETIAKLEWPENANPFDPKLSIEAGAFYMSYLIGEWSWPRSTMDRHCLALASYNAGLKHILTAQKREGDPSDYAEIIVGLPGVTGENSTETINYVKLIFNHYRDLLVKV